MDGNSEADTGGLAEARECALGHDTSQKEVKTGAEQEAANYALTESSFHVPAAVLRLLSERAEE